MIADRISQKAGDGQLFKVLCSGNLVGWVIGDGFEENCGVS